MKRRPLSHFKVVTGLVILSCSGLAVERCVGRQVFEDYSPRPFAHALRVDEPPAIDGDLTDSIYARTQPLLDFNSRFLRLPASQPTEVRLVWNDHGLFAAVRCLEENMAEVISITTERDGAVEGDNGIELTFSPAKPSSDFFRFVTNTLGTLYDEYAGNRGWDGEWVVAVRRQDDGWSAEFSIPWSTIDRRPELGEIWGLGVARVEGPSAEYSNWAVVDGDWSQRDRHGQLEFTDKADLPYIETIQLDRLIPGYNLLSGKVVRAASPEALYTVRFQRWEQPPGQLPREVDLAELSVSGATPSFEFETTVERPGTYLLTFTLLFGTDVLYRSTLGYHARPVQGERFALESKQSIYTWEDEARFYLSVDPAVIEKDMKIITEINAATGRLLRIQEETITGPRHVIRMPISDLPDATYRVDISLEHSQKILASWSALFDRESSVPAPPRVFTRKDGVIVVGEDPFFPLGVFQAPDIAELAEAGFNVVVGREVPAFSREREVALYLNRCKKLGLLAVLTVESHILPELKREALRDAVGRVRDHPALLGYLVLDRPSSAGIEPGYVDMARVIVRDVDRYHPVLILEDKPVMFPGYAGTCDLFIAASSPVPFSTLLSVKDVLDRAWRATREKSSVLACLQAFGPPAASRHPTMKESRVMAWMALMHNAKGLLWWSYEEAKRAGHWGDLKRMAKELRPILPLILGGSPSEVRSSVSSPGVHMRFWDLGGELLVLAANTQARAGRIPLPGEWENVKNLLAGEPPIESPHGSSPAQIFLGPYGVAALILPAGHP